MASSTKSGKLVIKTDLSYKSPLIPILTKEQDSIIVDSLCSLLETIGRYRATQQSVPKRKKDRKRKRATTNAPETAPVAPLLKEVQQPQLPPLFDSITVGLNSTSRFLEEQASLVSPQTIVKGIYQKDSQAVEGESQRHNLSGSKQMAAIFLPRPANDILYTHLPPLCYTASLANKSAPDIRLVLLDRSAERRLAASMGIPRAGVIGIMEDAPGSKALLEYVREQIPAVEIPWMSQALNGDWMGTQTELNATGLSR